MSIGAILLAAGSSSRMGQSKQLLQINGESLLRSSVNIVLEAGLKNVVVVLGSNAEAHHNLIEHLPIQIITNADWKKGMGNSLKTGVIHLLQSNTPLHAVIILVCDQPLLTSGHLKKLIDKFHDTKNQIIASQYNNTLGVPALFDQSLFPELKNCVDEQGAKKIIQQHKHLVNAIDFPGGEIDLDTLEDYNQFLKFKY
jgi:molybdenum cofactor cytidylyltransferase